MTATAFRALGLAPLAFFATYAGAAANGDRAGDALWMCHVANLVLGLGMILERPAWIRVAAAWIVLGIPLWVIDMATSGTICPFSTISHVGGLAVAIFALNRVRATRNEWIGGVALLVAMQLLARVATPEALNVNLAWRPYEGFERWPGGYPGYWASLMAGAAFTLWGIGRVMQAAFPPRPAITERSIP
jgi:hypothetical protein